MQNKLTETLTSFISEITQMERNNTKLNEDIRELEKEKEKGYKSFNTETHVLVERETLSKILTEYVKEEKEDKTPAVKKVIICTPTIKKGDNNA